MAVRSKCLAARQSSAAAASLHLPLFFTQRITAEEEDSNGRNSHHPAQNGEATLKLSHPLLRALESHGNTNKEFDQLHAQLVVTGLFQHPLAAGRAIRKLCIGDAHSVHHAISLFSCLDQPDAFICNVIIKSLIASYGPGPAFSFYRHHMLRRSVRPNHFTFPLLSKIFSLVCAVAEGETTHARVTKSGLELNLFVRNSLIHMYLSFGNVGCARKLFDLGVVCESDLVTWNSMIDGYGKNGMVDAARELFDRMSERDNISWNTMIAGHAGEGDMETAEQLFSIMPQTDTVTWNVLLDGYANLSEVVPARILFDTMPDPNVVSWNIMLALYVRKKDFKECLKLFDRMTTMAATGGGAQREVSPNEATLVSVLAACAHLGELERGRWIHSYIIDSHWRIQPDVLLSTALQTMYAKCGDMNSAREVFDQMPDRNVVSWNSMIMGYGMHGHGEKALEMFLEMERSSTRPNGATLVCILCACTHSGMILEGWWCYNRMVRVHGIRPKVEHYGCMVDLLGRAGMLRDSEELVNKMQEEKPQAAAPALLGALLSACTTQSNWEVGEIVGKKLIELQPTDVGSYVLLSNVYAAQGRWDDVERVRKMMMAEGLVKAAGISLVGSSSDYSSCQSLEVEEGVHKKSMVYSMLSEMGAHMKLPCR